MGGLFGGKEKKKGNKKEPLLSILTIGNSSAGKTALINRYHSKRFDPTIITTANDFVISHKKLKDKAGEEVDVKIKIWDSPGQERFENIVLTAVKNTQGILLVFDITEKQSFDDLQKWIEKVESCKDIKTFPFILVANKIDLNDKRAIKEEQYKEFASKYGLQYFETSAKSGIGVDEAFDALITRVYNTTNKTSSNFVIS